MTTKSRLIGYIRVSTAEQNTDLQWDALRAANCHLVFQDKVSGTRWSRKGLNDALDAVRPGDRLAIWRIDRLGRSIAHILSVITDLNERGAGVLSLSENCDTATENGEMQAIFLAVVAHMEHRAIVRRTRAGVEAAARRGKHRGGRPKMSADQIREARLLMDGGTMNAKAIADRYHVGRATLFRNVRCDASPLDGPTSAATRQHRRRGLVIEALRP